VLIKLWKVWCSILSLIVWIILGALYRSLSIKNKEEPKCSQRLTDKWVNIPLFFFSHFSFLRSLSLCLSVPPPLSLSYFFVFSLSLFLLPFCLSLSFCLSFFLSPSFRLSFLFFPYPLPFFLTIYLPIPSLNAPSQRDTQIRQTTLP
jgi:hypothetical protein